MYDASQLRITAVIETLNIQILSTSLLLEYDNYDKYDEYWKRLCRVVRGYELTWIRLFSLVRVP